MPKDGQTEDRIEDTEKLVEANGATEISVPKVTGSP